jgi:hypothetical protein
MFLHKQPDFKKSEIKGRKGESFLCKNLKKNIEKSLAAANAFRILFIKVKLRLCITVMVSQTSFFLFFF